MPVPDPANLRPQVRRRLRRLWRHASGFARVGRRGRHNEGTTSLNDAVAASPLMFAHKTYNTAHPDYEPELAGNYPDRIFDAALPCDNALFRAVKQLVRWKKVPNHAWTHELEIAMQEAKTVPGFDQIMERKIFIEQYLAQLTQRYGSHYVAGWVNIEDALFLYWSVRKLKPKTIVQTGVSNGLSSAFMMLALAKNGPGSKLYAIDLPAIFDPNDPAWTQKDTVFGVVVPQGQSSGWMVPDIYHERFEVQLGDAKALLPSLIDRLDTFELFYHDSDHTYDHMMFEFDQAIRKLAPGGVIIADDISWNASLWDFAKKLRVPSYNFRGTMGVAFLSDSRP